jgi:hypothetical protein
MQLTIQALALHQILYDQSVTSLRAFDCFCHMRQEVVSPNFLLTLQSRSVASVEFRLNTPIPDPIDLEFKDQARTGYPHIEREV